MHKLLKAMILGLSVIFSYSAFATVYEENDIVGYVDGHQITWGKYYNELQTQNPDMITWCKYKREFAFASFNDRENISVNEMIADVDLIKKDNNIPRYIYLDLIRVIRTAGRKNSAGEYVISASKGHVFATKTFQQCIINQF